MTVSVAQSPLRVFFNPDTCKLFHHDLQWGKCRLGAGRPPEGLFSQQMMRNTLMFRAGQAFVVCCSQTYGKLNVTMKAMTENRLPKDCLNAYCFYVCD